MVQPAVLSPSTVTIWPVMKDAASEAMDSGWLADRGENCKARFEKIALKSGAEACSAPK